MAQDTWSPDSNNALDYRLIFHKLTVPKCFIDYVHNFEYSFLWKCDDCEAVATDPQTFDKQSCAISFNKTKLKLRFNPFKHDHNDYNDSERNYNSTQLILREKHMNRRQEHMVNLDEITLTTNYFALNKRQSTNITFNKVIADNIRIELRLNVTLVSKQIYSIERRISSSNCSESMKEKEEKKEKKEVVMKWLNNMNKMDGYNSSSRSVCSDSLKKRRSGLCAGSVAKFYQKSKEIEEKKKEESKLIDEQIKNDYNEMGNKLIINIEESKQLKSQIGVLQNLLYEKNVEIDELRRINRENREEIRVLKGENHKYVNNQYDVNEKLSENKILMQTMKYELQCRYSKYNELLNVMKIKKKNTLKKYIAQLVVDNDGLEFELQRIANSWRDTSTLLERYSNEQIQKYKKLKVLYKDQAKQNHDYKELLIKHGILDEHNDENDDDDGDIMDNDIDSNCDTEINALWDDDDDEDTRSDTAF